MVSDEALSCIGNLIPRINPASRYANAMSLVRQRKAFASVYFNTHEGYESGENYDDASALSRPVKRDSTASVNWTHNPQVHRNVHEKAKSLQAAQGNLPEGWFVDRDPKSGLLYYFKMDGTSSWNPPEENENNGRSLSMAFRSISRAFTRN